jgi:hypothetical protein
MPTKKKAGRKVPAIVAAVVRPVNTRLSRMEDLLIEMRWEHDVRLKKINRLQEQIDALTEFIAGDPLPTAKVSLMAKRGRDAVLLPPLPMKFQEALADYLKVQPEPKKPKPKRKRARNAKAR